MMKNEITISELANLMNVSVHQIRYFEEKGVLLPAYIDNNQYRMYGIDQVYRLSHILLLRRLGVPVSSIKDCIDCYSPDQHRQLLHRTLEEVDAELRRLHELRQFIDKVLDEQMSFSQQSAEYEVKQRDTTYLARWLEIEPHVRLQARRLTEQADRVPNLFESDIYYLHDGSGATILYIETQKPGDLCLPGGSYLTKQALVSEEAELDRLIGQFYNDAAAQSHMLTGPLVLVEKSYLSLFSSGKLHYELQALLDPAANMV